LEKIIFAGNLLNPAASDRELLRCVFDCWYSSYWAFWCSQV